MLKKIGPTLKGVSKWRIELRMPKEYAKPRVCTNFEATEAEAHAMHANLLGIRARAKLGLPIGEDSSLVPSLAEACAKYESHLRTSGRTDEYITDVTFEFERLRKLLGEKIPITAVTRANLIQWLDMRKDLEYRGKKPGPRTLNKALAMLSSFFGFCQNEAGWVKSNPAAAINKMKEIEKLPKIVSWANYLAFVAAAWKERPAFAVFLEVLAESGSRVDELQRAVVGDIDAERKVWKKTVKPGRQVEPECMEWAMWCAAGREKTAPLCPDEDGKAWTYTMIKKAFIRYRAATTEAGLMPHHLRHARACWQLADGWPVQRVQHFLSHTSLKTTEGYIRMAESVRRQDAGITHSTVCQNMPQIPWKSWYACGVAGVVHLENNGLKAIRENRLKHKSGL